MICLMMKLNSYRRFAKYRYSIPSELVIELKRKRNKSEVHLALRFFVFFPHFNETVSFKKTKTKNETTLLNLRSRPSSSAVVILCVSLLLKKIINVACVVDKS